jgi:general secretion pathway protein A
VRRGGQNVRASPTTWEKFYGLRSRAFSLTPDLRFVYHSESHSRAFEQVTSALRRREGLIVVTGEVGTGKTMLCRSLLETFETRIFQSVILDPLLSVEDLLYQILSDFGLISESKTKRREPFTDVTRHALVATLQKFLASLVPLDAHAVIMIDEAQHLGPQVLEEIRLLSNFETDQAKLLQIVLVGQPNLEGLLRRPDMRQLNQRVARRCELKPLTSAEVSAYVQHRLTVAAEPPPDAVPEPGAEPAGEPVRFTPEALEAVATIAQGIPRTVNTLCDRALEAAFAHKRRPIDLDAVLEGAAHLKLQVPETETPTEAAGSSVWKLYATAAALTLVAVLGTWLWLRTPDTAVPETPQPAGRSPAAATGPPQPSSTPSSVAGPPDTGSPPSQASPATPQTATATSSAPAATTGSYQIVVASFRTEERATVAVDELKRLGRPASSRFDPAGWYVVSAGPFSTADEARGAQAELARVGYSGTRIALMPPGQ